jgi:hypothetical protein
MAPIVTIPGLRKAPGHYASFARCVLINAEVILMAMNIKEMVVAELDNVPAALLPEVLRFVRFIKSQSNDVLVTDAPKITTVSSEQVAALSGLADFSGDALADTERLYAD